MRNLMLIASIVSLTPILACEDERNPPKPIETATTASTPGLCEHSLPACETDDGESSSDETGSSGSSSDESSSGGAATGESTT